MTEAYTRREKYEMKFDKVLLDSDMSEISTLPYNGCEVLGVSDSGIYCVIYISTRTVSDLIKGRLQVNS